MQLVISPYSYIHDRIFVMRAYGSPDLSGRDVIDVGASIADTLLYFASLGARKIYGFESDAFLYLTGLKNIRLNGMQDKVYY